MRGEVRIPMGYKEIQRTFAKVGDRVQGPRGPAWREIVQVDPVDRGFFTTLTAARGSWEKKLYKVVVYDAEVQNVRVARKLESL